MRTHLIYMYVFPNQKVYIGQTTGSGMKAVNKRSCRGKGYKGQRVGKAIAHFGWDNIRKEIVVEGLTQEEANECEVFYIKGLDATNKRNGYNVHEGGGVNQRSGEPKYDREWRREYMRKYMKKYFDDHPEYKQRNRKKASSQYSRNKEKYNERQKVYKDRMLIEEELITCFESPINIIMEKKLLKRIRNAMYQREYRKKHMK